jgi:hypothetical protein
MSSAWWFLVAFVAGGWCGMLVMALMRIAGDLPEPSETSPGATIDPVRLRQSTSSATAGKRVGEGGY